MQQWQLRLVQLERLVDLPNGVRGPVNAQNGVRNVECERYGREKSQPEVSRDKFFSN
jgi:hypothetical protein